MKFRVLAVGDVCGDVGLDLVRRKLKRLRTENKIDFCILNGENSNGIGIKPEHAELLLNAGADVITLGNHSYYCKEIENYLNDCPYILRPANDSPLHSGRGVGVYDSKIGPITVVNLIGRCGMDYGPDNPFLLVDRILKENKSKCVFLDFHAEATSEKLAMAYYLDGKVSALWGTHTHVPTADLQILPKGTGYVTDLGMTGPIRSVLGVVCEQSITHFRGGSHSRYKTAPGPCKLEGVIFTIDSETGTCVETERLFYYDQDTARG